MMKKYLALFIILSICGCSRIPNKINNPKVVFKSEIKENDVFYTILIKGTLANENPETVIKDIKGEIIIKRDRVLAVIPFDIAVLLPFSVQKLNVEKEGKESEMKPLMDLFNINPDNLIRGGFISYSDEMNINPDYIEFNIKSYKTENIIDIIRGTRNESK